MEYTKRRTQQESEEKARATLNERMRYPDTPNIHTAHMLHTKIFPFHELR